MIDENELDNILKDSIFEITDTEKKLFNIPDVIKKGNQVKKNTTDKVAKRILCEDFKKFESMFDKIKNDLRIGRRSLLPYHENSIESGVFYIANGQMAYIDEISLYKRQIKSRLRNDGRTRVIYDDGTESNILFRTIGKNITKNGYIISEPNDVEINIESNNKFELKPEDKSTGWIYVLKSLSKKQEIAEIANLYKIGFSTVPVEERIKNSERESTYLFDKVEIVQTFETFNMNVHKLESAIHDFLSQVKVDIKVRDERGNIFSPKEWFTIPLEIFENIISRINDGSIVNYIYNQKLQVLEFKSIVDNIDNRFIKEIDSSNMNILNLYIKKRLFDEIYLKKKKIETQCIKQTQLRKFTELDRDTGRYHIKRFDAIRYFAGKQKNKDMMLVEVIDVKLEKDNTVKYYLGEILEYNIEKK